MSHVTLSRLVAFERASGLLHKMDFANSCLEHPHRRKASQLINGNSRQTTEAKDTSVCKCFQMETSFSLYSSVLFLENCWDRSIVVECIRIIRPDFLSKKNPTTSWKGKTLSKKINHNVFPVVCQHVFFWRRERKPIWEKQNWVGGTSWRGLVF